MEQQRNNSDVEEDAVRSDVDSSESDSEEEQCVSGDKEFTSVMMNDKNVEITGIIETVDMTRTYGEGKFQKTLKRFVIGNNETKRIRCIIWGDARIKELTHFLELGNILEINGGVAVEPNRQFFPNDRSIVPIELNITAETKLISHGKPKKESSMEATVVDFETIANSSGRISIEAWIKQPFRMTSADRMCWIIGTLTNGQSKINLRFRDVSKPQSYNLFRRGDKVRVEGFVDVDEKTQVVEITATNSQNIVKLDGERMSKKTCKDGFRPILKKARLE